MKTRLEIAQRAKKYYEKHREKNLERARKYYEKHREEVKARMKEHRKNLRMQEDKNRIIRTLNWLRANPTIPPSKPNPSQETSIS